MARLKYASGLFNMMRNLGGAVGIAVCGAILNSRTNAHFTDIASTLTPANGAMERMLHGTAQRYTAAFHSAAEGHLAAIKHLSQLTYREAATMAYADAFQAIMVAFILATLFVPLLRKVAAPAAPSTDAH
jgi:DHA2 family multidrug resistance protein